MLRTGRSPGAAAPGGPPGRFQPGSGKAVLRAFPYLRTYRRDAGGAFVALLLVSAANLASPLFIRLAIDRGLEDIAYCGVGVAMDASADVFFLLATRQGFLSITAGVASLYPVATALLAVFIVRERLRAT